MEFKGTPAPWRWELNETSKNITLCGGVPKYDLIVMDFVRYGMNGACPRFNTTHESGFNILERADTMGVAVEGREHHQSWFKNINHPDALLISKAPEMLDMLKDILDCYNSGDVYHEYKIKQLIKEATEL